MPDPHLHQGHSHGEFDATSPLGFTGERVIPDDPKWAWCFQAHLFGYEDLVGRTKPGGVMLDIGCGEGYGSSVLASHAKQLVTGDVSFEAVKHARDRYKEPNIAWVVFDGQRLPFKKGAFDVVSSLQVIEHFAGTEEHLADVVRALKPGGLHYVTTPNIDKMGDAEKDNPFHLRDFTAADLRDALERHFEDARLEGMFYVEDSPRYRALVAAEAKEESMRPKLERVEERLAKLPGAVRARIRPLARRMAGVKEWPLADAESARNAIVASDFAAREPAGESFCLIGIARKKAASKPVAKKAASKPRATTARRGAAKRR